MKKMLMVGLALLMTTGLLVGNPLSAFTNDPNSNVMPEKAPDDPNALDITYDRFKIGVSPQPQTGAAYGAPAACQAILALRGIHRTQDQLAQELGTGPNGTGVGRLAPLLNRYIGWSEYPQAGEPGYRLGQIHSHNDADEAELWQRIKDSYETGDPIVFLINTGHFDEGEAEMRFVLGNGYRVGHLTDYPKNKPWRDVVFFDTKPSAYDSEFGYERAEFLREFMDAMVEAGGYYIW